MAWWVLLRKTASGMPPWLREDHLKSVSHKHCRFAYEAKKILKNGVTSTCYQPCISLAFVFIPGTHLTSPGAKDGHWQLEPAFWSQLCHPSEYIRSIPCEPGKNTVLRERQRRMSQLASLAHRVTKFRAKKDFGS